MKIYSYASLVLTTLALAACGESEGGVASASSTPVADPNARMVGETVLSRTPLDPQPAWKSGTYDAIFVDYYHLSNGSEPSNTAGSARIGVDAATRTYTLTVTGGPLDVPTMSLTSPPTDLSLGRTGREIGNRVTFKTTWSDGVERPGDTFTRDIRDGSFNGRANWADRFIDAGLGVKGPAANHYASLAYWQADEYLIEGSSYRGNRATVGYAAFGDRTAPGDLPQTGSATYRVTDSVGNTPFFAELTANFSTMLMSLGYRFDEQFDFYREGAIAKGCSEDGCWYDPADRAGTMFLSSQVAGDGAIKADGSFLIPLAGTGTVRTDRVDGNAVADIRTPLTGQVGGAFFGPQGVEVGGAFQLPSVRADGSTSETIGAFAAVKN